MQTLLLDRTAWDLCIDSSGNIAVASEPYSLAQDAASAIRLFHGEYIFDTTIGIPYFEQILGKNLAIGLIRRKQQAAALTVPGVTSANIFYSAFVNGQLSGQVQVSDVNNAMTATGF